MHALSILLIWVLISGYANTVDQKGASSHDMQRVVILPNSFCLLRLLINLCGAY